jgi:adenosylcobinamide-phosphate synthase
MIGPVELFLAFALDMLIGDPRWLPHPVRGIGRFIGFVDKRRGIKFDGPLSGRMGGVLLLVVVAGGTFAGTWVLTDYLRGLPVGDFRIIGIIIYIYLVASTLALRGLIDSVKAVVDTPDLAAARARVGMIVGRDTKKLDHEGVRRAALESLAENASDGVIAPLFYLAVGGLPLALTYKAVNTLDSMVGYKSEKYIKFGWASARLDDIFNLIPARITGLLFVLASFFSSGFDIKEAARAMKVMWRDGRKHSSPNAGVSEAAMAGAVGVKLGGPAVYGGVVYEKPYINEEGAPVEEEHVRRGISIVIMASLLALGFTALVVVLRSIL